MFVWKTGFPAALTRFDVWKPVQVESICPSVCRETAIYTKTSFQLRNQETPMNRDGKFSKTRVSSTDSRFPHEAETTGSFCTTESTGATRRVSSVLAGTRGFGVAGFVTFDVVRFGLIQQTGRGDPHGAAAGTGSTGRVQSSGTDTVTSICSGGREGGREGEHAPAPASSSASCVIHTEKPAHFFILKAPLNYP